MICNTLKIVITANTVHFIQHSEVIRHAKRAVLEKHLFYWI